MAIEIKHAFVSAKVDGPDTTQVQPSDWNEVHSIEMSTARLLGRTTAANGPAEEISVGSGLTLSAGVLAMVASAIFPTGGIIMWSGSIGSIPAGWALCDGTAGTPNLRDKFIVGAGSAYTVGATGGAATVTLVEANMPAHTHSFSATTSSDGNHVHNVPQIYTGGLQHNQGGSTNISSNGQTGHAAPPGADTAAAGAHTHTVSGTTGSQGSGTAHENLPPYYSLAYIMKT